MQIIDVLAWPPRSPNLNPLEHAWELVKQKLNECPCKGMLQLWEHVQTSFHSITCEQCQKLYHSMPIRIQVVLASKAGWTNYSSICKCRLQILRECIYMKFSPNHCFSTCSFAVGIRDFENDVLDHDYRLT